MCEYHGVVAWNESREKKLGFDNERHHKNSGEGKLKKHIIMLSTGFSHALCIAASVDIHKFVVWVCVHALWIVHAGRVMQCCGVEWAKSEKIVLNCNEFWSSTSCSAVDCGFRNYNTFNHPCYRYCCCGSSLPPLVINTATHRQINTISALWIPHWCLLLILSTWMLSSLLFTLNGAADDCVWWACGLFISGENCCFTTVSAIYLYLSIPIYTNIV